MLDKKKLTRTVETNFKHRYRLLKYQYRLEPLKVYEIAWLATYEEFDNYGLVRKRVRYMYNELAKKFSK